MTRARKPAKPTHRTDSGMGGVFDVVILKEMDGDRALVMVVANGPDWNGHQFGVAKSELRPLP